MNDFFNKYLSRVSLRLRLTLWYVLLFGIISLFLGFYLHMQLQNTMLKLIDLSLKVAATQASANLDFDNENGKIVFQKREDQYSDSQYVRQTGSALRIFSINGKLMDGLGKYKNLPAWDYSKKGFFTEIAKDEFWRVYNTPVSGEGGKIIYWIQSVQSMDFMSKTVEEMTGSIIIGLFLALLLAGIGGHIIVNNAFKPIIKVTETAEKINVSDLSLRINYRGTASEIKKLVANFNKMLGRLKNSFVKERRFTSDASHELRTPLTVLKGQIGVTLGKPRSVKEYRETLLNLQEQVDRLIRLTNDLLFLARADQNLLKQGYEQFDIGRLIENIIDDFTPMIRDKHITLKKQLLEHAVIEGNRGQIVRLFLNLLDNALKYTEPGGEIGISMKYDRPYICVAVCNTGKKIPDENISHIFDRFYRVMPDRSRETGGSGLGLAIVREIVNTHNGRIEVKSDPGNVITFVTYLPNAKS